MKTIAIALALLLAASTALHAKNLRYFGKESGDGTRGRIQHEGRSSSVRVGDEIPGWGRVKAVKDEELVLERELTAEQKRERHEKGLAAADVEDIHVPNARGNAAAPQE